MPDITFDCPNCQASLLIDGKGAGLQVNCPECKVRITIPLPKTDQNETPALDSQTTPATQSQEDQPDPSPAKKCPSCGAEMVQDAVFCFMCGTNLKTGQRRAFARPENAAGGATVKDDEQMAAVIPKHHVEPPAQPVARSFNTPWRLYILLALAGCYLLFWMMGNPLWPFKKTSSSSASGEWRLYFGVDVEKLTLADAGGVITGTITKDTDFGGTPITLHGMRVGQEIEMSYTAQLTSEDHDILSCQAVYCLKGQIEGNNMSGNCKVSVITCFKSGGAIPGSSERLWKAERN